MSGFNCLICNHLIDHGISKQVVQKTEGKCQLLSTILQQNTTATTAGSSFFDLSEFLNLWTTSGAGAGCQICPECDAKLVQLGHYLEQLSSLQASIDRIQQEIREDSIKSQLARKTKIEPTTAAELLDDNDSFDYNYNGSNDQDFCLIDEIETEQGDEIDGPNNTGNYQEARILLEPLNLPAGVLTFNLKTDKDLIQYINRNQVFIKKSNGKGSGKKKAEKQYKCDVRGCKKTFVAINFLMAHKKGHSKNGGIYSCDLCNRVFKLSNSLAVHLMLNHGIGDKKTIEKYKCTLCQPEKIFEKPSRLDRHLKRHHEKSTLKLKTICEICGQEILGIKMDYHLQLKHGVGEGLVKCPKCPTDQFYKPGSKVYEIHLAHHEKLELKYPNHQMTYFCEFCTLSFVVEKAFEEHKLRKHLNPGLKEKCFHEECGLEFSSKSRLGRHIKDVHDNLYQCPHCTRQFTNPKSLKVHIKRHLGQKDYKCTSNGCERSFFEPSGLLHHKRTAHSLTKPFRCSYKSCSKAFFIKDSLKRHETLHTGEIRFVCEFCSEGYTVKESLRIHIQSKHQNPNTIVVGNNPRKQEYTRRPKIKILQKSEESI